MAGSRQPNVKVGIVFPLQNYSGKDGAAGRRRCALAGALTGTIREPARPDLAALNAATDDEVAREEAITHAAGIPKPVAFWPRE